MTDISPQRIVVGMSGGVDSTVAALLLRESGCDVHGLFMFNWDEDEEGYCNAADDYAEARAACERLGLPLHRVEFAGEYRRRVFHHFLAEHRRGRTPNPDVLCNREIKFGVFLDYARRLGGEAIATGHYARIRLDADGTHRLLKGVDSNKDQSYFLHAVDQSGIAAARFPLGELCKEEVRALARTHGLRNYNRRDSTGICFIGERPFRDFLKRYLPPAPGDMRTPEGQRVGRHEGLGFYTLGQRQGLGIGGRRGGAGAPWYVVGKNIDANELIVAQGHDHPLLFSSALVAGEFGWMGRRRDAFPLECRVKVRYRQQEQLCVVRELTAGRVRIDFAAPQRAVTPGQYAVLYSDEEVLGGGVIEETLPAPAAGIPPTRDRGRAVSI